MIANINNDHHMYILVGILLASFLLSSSVNAAHPECKLCHTSNAATKNSASLRVEPPGLCRECHKQHASKFDHSVGTKPSMDIPAQLPLRKGLMGCTTCHDPHGKSPGLLRIEAEELCVACH